MAKDTATNDTNAGEGQQGNAGNANTDGNNNTGAADGQQSSNAASSNTDGNSGGQPDGQSGDSASADGGQTKDGGDGGDVKYELKLPEKSVLGDAVVGKTAELAKEMNLSPEHAQKLLEHNNNIVGEYLSGIQSEWTQRVQDWETELKNDEKFGGDSFDANSAAVQNVMDRFGSQELKDVLNATGYGNFPPLVKLLQNVAKAMSEDTFHTGQGEGQGQRDKADILYPNQNQT